MVKLKTPAEIEIMAEAGRKLKGVLKQLVSFSQKGRRTKEIEALAQELIFKEKAKPSFSTVPGYHWATCLPVNEQVVHTPPSNYRLQTGDVLTIDVGLYYQGFHSDMATTLIIDKNEKRDKEKIKFLELGRRTLNKAIKHFRKGHYLGEVSALIEKEINGGDAYIIKELTGHGIGRSLHEDPYVFNYLERPIKKTLKIDNGLVVDIEVIYAQGGEDIDYHEDEWSIKSADNSLTASFEKMVAIYNGKTRILT